MHRLDEIRTVDYSTMSIATTKENMHLKIRVKDIVRFLEVINKTIKTLGIL